MSRIYLASSWKNQYQPEVVLRLRQYGHEVYDFKNPQEGQHGFSWSEIDRDWQEWNPEQFREALETQPARRGFSLDMQALRWCQTCVLLLPCGKSAHLELGWAAGTGKRTAILMVQKDTPELMYKMSGGIFADLEELHRWL